MDVKLARLLDLGIAFDPRGLFSPEYVAPGGKPRTEGPWRVYRRFAGPDERCANPVRDGLAEDQIASRLSPCQTA